MNTGSTSTEFRAGLPLPELMVLMDAAGWSYSHSSRLVRGKRRYSASVWREGERTNLPKCRASTPSAALAGALAATEQAYRRGRVRFAQPRTNKRDLK